MIILTSPTTRHGCGEKCEPVRVLVCAEHPHMSWGLKKLIEGEWPRLMPVASCGDLADAERLLGSRRAEVVIVDLPQPASPMLPTLRRLCRTFDTAFIVLVGIPSEAERIADAGVRAVLPSDSPADRILEAVYRAVGKSCER